MFLTACENPFQKTKEAEPVVVSSVSEAEPAVYYASSLEAGDDSSDITGQSGKKVLNLAPEVIIGYVSDPSASALGLLENMDNKNDTRQEYTLLGEADTDTLITALCNHEISAAVLSPVEAAASWQQNGGSFSVISLNSLVNLYVVSGDSTIGLITDLDGKTIYLSGESTVEEYAVRQVLQAYNMNNVVLDFLSSDDEVSAKIQEDGSVCGILPEDSAVRLCQTNNAYSMVLSLASCYRSNPLTLGTELIGTVIAADKQFIEQYPDSVDVLLDELVTAVENTRRDPFTAAAANVAAGVLPDSGYQTGLVQNAQLTVLKNHEMETALSGYLTGVFSANPELLGGAMPDGSFYYINEATEVPSPS